MQVAVDAVNLNWNKARLSTLQKRHQMDRLAQLEAQAAALNAEIAALKAGKPAPVPRPPRDEGARVVVLNDERRDLPDLASMRKLYAVVKNHVPEVKSQDPDRPFRGFCATFRYISNCGRVAAPNSKYTLGWWIDDLTQWLRQRDAMTIDVSGSSFIAAVLGSGDVLYVPHNGTLGHVWEFGIVSPNHGGKPASADGWRTVLSTGNVLPPSAPARRMAPPSPVRIVSGW
jgi:hypothetical protein